MSKRLGPQTNHPGTAPAAERHIIFLEELGRHSDREVCLGAAECAAGHADWMFDPWPLQSPPTSVPTLADTRMVSGILSTERSFRRFQRLRGSPTGPVVFFLAEEAHGNADAVEIDEMAVGALAAAHLWDRGLRQFAFIGSSETAWSKGRELGFASWLQARGAVPAKHLFSIAALPIYWSANLARRNLRLQELVCGLPKPCGILTANDVIACFVLHAARHVRRRVPEDLGVVGVDNDPLPNAASGLAISSVELPFREVGRQAVRLLAERWQGRADTRVIRLAPVRVVPRTSTDAFMTQDPLVRKAQDYVESRRATHVTVQEVTRVVGSNRMTLGGRFQRELGTTLGGYVRRRRMAYAEDRLRQANATVEQVAAECGFSSTSYFSRTFRRVTGSHAGSIRRLRLGTALTKPAPS
jgi:LacI family transcriptional regulator